MTLNNDDACWQPNKLPTPYNDNPLIPAYPGIMFDFTPLFEGTVTTLEVDVRLNEATTYEIEVFSSRDKFLENIGDETAWTRHANTKAKVAPGGQGLIIPEREFLPLQVSPREQLSFYIQMKGPWIDTRAEALVKTGEMFQQSSDMVVYVGVGLNSRFADDFDKTVDPQFSGVIHYRKVVDCPDEDQDVFTEVSFPVLLPRKPNPVFDGQVKDAIVQVARENLFASVPFDEMVSDYRLRVSDKTDFSSLPSELECPPEWSYCPPAAINTILSFSHKAGLRSGQIQYQVLRAADAIVAEMTKMLGLEDALFVGLRPAAASFEIRLNGPPIDWTANDKDFFEQFTAGFFNNIIGENSEFIAVFDSITLDKPSQRSLRGLEGISTVFGTVFGAQGAFLPSHNFPLQLNDVVFEEKDFYLESLRTGVYTTENVAVISSDAFEGVTDIQAVFKHLGVTDLTMEPVGAQRLSGKTLLFPSIGIVVLILCSLVYFGPKILKQRREYKKSLETYREEMRQRRREKRDSAISSASQSDGAESRADSLEKDFANALDAAFELGYDAYKEKVETCGLSALSGERLAGEETCLRKSNHSMKLERASSHSHFSLNLEDDDLCDSDLDEDLSDGSFEGGGASVASGDRSVVSRSSQASSKSGRSLLSAFMEKQLEKQERQGLNPSVASGATKNSHSSFARGPPQRSRSYMGDQYTTTGRPGSRRSVSGELNNFRRNSATAPKSVPVPGPSKMGPGVKKTLSGYFADATGAAKESRPGAFRSKSFDAGAYPRTGDLDSCSVHTTGSISSHQSASIYAGRRIYVAPTPSRHSKSHSVRSARSTESREGIRAMANVVGECEKVGASTSNQNFTAPYDDLQPGQEKLSPRRESSTIIPGTYEAQNETASPSKKLSPCRESSTIRPGQSEAASPTKNLSPRRESRTIIPGSFRVQNEAASTSKTTSTFADYPNYTTTEAKTDDYPTISPPAPSSGGVLPDVVVLRRGGLQDFLDDDDDDDDDSVEEMNISSLSLGLFSPMKSRDQSFKFDPKDGGDAIVLRQSPETRHSFETEHTVDTKSLSESCSSISVNSPSFQQGQRKKNRKKKTRYSQSDPVIGDCVTELTELVTSGEEDEATGKRGHKKKDKKDRKKAMARTHSDPGFFSNEDLGIPSVADEGEAQQNTKKHKKKEKESDPRKAMTRTHSDPGIFSQADLGAEHLTKKVFSDSADSLDARSVDSDTYLECMVADFLENVLMKPQPGKKDKTKKDKSKKSDKRKAPGRAKSDTELPRVDLLSIDKKPTTKHPEKKKKDKNSSSSSKRGVRRAKSFDCNARDSSLGVQSLDEYILLKQTRIQERLVDV